MKKNKTPRVTASSVRVPRLYYENLSSVTERLKSLVRSPELYRIRSLLDKDPIYLCFCDVDNLFITNPTYLWFTLRRKTATEYELVPVSFPCRFLMFSSSTVAVESEIYFIGGYPKSTELWILDTRSGTLRQGPIMQESRFLSRSAVGVIDGKIYVIQQVENGEIHEEVFDLESQGWKVAGIPVPEEKVDTRLMMKSCVTLKGKVYGMNNGSIIVYNLREGTSTTTTTTEKKQEKSWCALVTLIRVGERISGRLNGLVLMPPSHMPIVFCIV